MNKSLIRIYPTTDKNPQNVEIVSYIKLGKQRYEILLNKDIASISEYKLVRKK